MNRGRQLVLRRLREDRLELACGHFVNVKPSSHLPQTATCPTCATKKNGSPRERKRGI